MIIPWQRQKCRGSGIGFWNARIKPEEGIPECISSDTVDVVAGEARSMSRKQITPELPQPRDVRWLPANCVVQMGGSIMGCSSAAGRGGTSYEPKSRAG